MVTSPWLEDVFKTTATQVYALGSTYKPAESNDTTNTKSSQLSSDLKSEFY